MNLKPLPGRVLVEIREKYSHVATTEQKYDTKVSGICLAVSFDNHKGEWAEENLQTSYGDVVGKLVFWEEYENSQIIQRDGKNYAFVKIEDLYGYEDV